MGIARHREAIDPLGSRTHPRCPLVVVLGIFLKPACTGNRRDIFVGGSSFLYAVPVLLGAPPTYVLQAVVSFCSDYLFTGLTSRFHLVDRWMASLHTIHAVLLAAGALPGQEGVPVLPMWAVVVLTTATMFCFAMSKRCVAEKDFGSYRLWHTLWHVVGPASMVLIFYRYCGTGDTSSSGTVPFTAFTCTHSLFR